MVLCDTCKHLGNMASWPCEDCLQGDRYERKPMTNADRIRAASDGELTEFLLNRDLGVVEKASKTTGFTYKVDREQCLVDVIDWLKQEVEGNA